MTSAQRKVLAVASKGGHWIQLLRLRAAFADAKVAYVCTDPEYAQLLDGEQVYAVRDANRWTKLDLLACVLDVARVVLRYRPDVIITTGAAPGLLAILFGRLISAKTIWVDSIANVERLSLSGRLAMLFAHRTYAQWPELAGGRVHFAGQVLS